MNALFLAWQDPQRRLWHPVGRLCRRADQTYEYVYTRGARAAQQGGFQPIPPFNDWNGVYRSAELFPLFANRLPSPARADYGQFVEYLNFPRSADDPIALLARSGGRRAADSVEVFPCPEQTPDGAYHVHFFAHGLRHLPPASVDRVESLRAGERLLLVHDFQNPYDPRALMLRTGAGGPGDPQFVGWCPRYLLHDAFELLPRCPDGVAVHVERLNPPPAPIANRLLCSLTACWPADFRPCTNEDYQPIPTHASECPCN
jgi:hypothetical protein